MKTFVAVAAGVVLGVLVLPAGVQAAGDELYAKIAPSVWRVRTYDADGIALLSGSAVVIGPGKLLTNCHVLAKAKRVTVAQEKTSFPAKLQHIDVERDLCQLAASELTAPAVAIGDSDRVAVGQRVYTLGNPKGLALTLSDGLVSGLRKVDGSTSKIIQTSAPVSPGSSGGGLFDEQGRLVGITSLSLRDSQNLNFAVPINWLKELPGRSDAAIAAYRAGGKAEAPAAGEPAPKATASWAAINDMSKLPVDDASLREWYTFFLTRAPPRAIAISANGGSNVAAGFLMGADPFGSFPAARALRDCEKQTQRRCYLYAVDNEVVYKGELSPAK